MSIEEIRKINEAWEEQLGDDTSLWHYEPFSDGYWKEKYKIVLCNTEAYGDSRENCVLTLDKYKILLEKGIRTIKFSALFLYSLYKQLHNICITEKQLRELYKNKNINELLDGIRNTTYMNLRKEEKLQEGANEDTDGIYRFFCFNLSENDKDYPFYKYNKNFILDFFDELEADIFIITSNTGLDLLKKIYTDIIKLDSLQEDGMYKTKKTLFVSMRHPSRIGYNDILQKTKAIYEELQK